MQSIPLFPLNTIVFPRGRLPLQIFEARYLDMIRSCMRDGSGFGIVLIRQGSELASAGKMLRFCEVGTYCHIVDFTQLSSGLLGVTAEGLKTFRIRDSWQEPNALCMAAVEFRHQDSVDAAALEVGADFQEYVDLLRRLSEHPAVAELNLNIGFDNLRDVAWRLSEFLPISSGEKQTLLEIESPLQRLEQIDLYISALNR